MISADGPRQGAYLSRMTALDLTSIRRRALAHLIPPPKIALAEWAELGVELHGDAHIFRNRSGAAYSSDTLGDDFRDVRAAEFGPLDPRTIGHDFRRRGRAKPLPAAPRRKRSRTAWATPCRLLTRCSPPMCRSTWRRCAT